MKTVLVTGSNGFIGSQIIESLRLQNYNLICLSKGVNRLPKSKDIEYHDVDFLDLTTLKEVLAKCNPDIIVHCAALSKVDKCESDPDACERVNVSATKILVEFSEKCNARFIFFSSDFVFDGSKKTISELDKPNPISEYGRSKLLAEQIIKKSNLDWTIIRPVLVYGFSGTAARSNIFTWVYHSLKKGQSIQVVNDQIRTPTCVQDVVVLVQQIIEKGLTGFFNIGGSDIISVFDVALNIARLSGFDESLIESKCSSLISGGNLRPKFSCFNNDRIKGELGLTPMGLEEGVIFAIKQINHIE